MRWPVMLGVSVLANILLAIAWLQSGKSASPAEPPTPAESETITNTRTAVIVRRQFFSWQEVESRDYPTYIKNLRSIGCPEQTIRDIIIADVTQMLLDKYAGALEADARSGALQRWWTNRRTAADVQRTQSQTEAMFAERNTILTQLLGPNWATRETNTTRLGPYESYIQTTLEKDAVLKNMSPENKAALTKLFLESRSTHLLIPDPYLPEDAESEQERWAKAEGLLTPEQFLRAKLYFSIHAESLRNQLDAVPGFEIQPDEFRKMFQATESIDEQIALLANSEAATASAQLQKLTQQRDRAIRTALTPQRYELLVRLQDPAYRSAIEALTKGGDPRALEILYAINREASTEEARIQADEKLTQAQREIELKKLELEQLKATAQALGEEIAEDTPATQPRREPMKAHNVLPGEGLERIARIYSVTPEVLQAANPNIDFRNLPAGATVNVPLRMIYPLPPPPE